MSLISFKFSDSTFEALNDNVIRIQGIFAARFYQDELTSWEKLSKRNWEAEIIWEKSS